MRRATREGRSVLWEFGRGPEFARRGSLVSVNMVLSRSKEVYKSCLYEICLYLLGLFNVCKPINIINIDSVTLNKLPVPRDAVHKCWEGCCLPFIGEAISL